MRYLSFLKWWLFFSLVVIGTIFSYYLGIVGEIWQKDASYLSAVTLAFFYFTSLLCGLHVYKACRANPTQEQLRVFEQHEEVGWFVSEMCLNLGMLGTIIGFSMMLTGFHTLDISKQQTVQELLTELGKSMATALYTTLVGLICGQLLKVQYFVLSLELQKKGSVLRASVLEGPNEK